MSVTGLSLLIKSQAGLLTPFAIHQGPCSLITELKTAAQIIHLFPFIMETYTEEEIYDNLQTMTFLAFQLCHCLLVVFLWMACVCARELTFCCKMKGGVNTNQTYRFFN